MHRKVAVALVAALALGLAGCGGGQKTETVSRAELISRLEAACRAGQREARRQMQADRGQAAFIQAILANLKTINDEVGNLETSGAAKPLFDTYKRTLPTRIEALEKIASADSADRQQVIKAQRVVIGAAGEKGHAAFLQIGARHICI
jgi:DNA repair exonuclease SbcCD ATPase subunit